MPAPDLIRGLASNLRKRQDQSTFSSDGCANGGFPRFGFSTLRSGARKTTISTRHHLNVDWS
jgi:hypothetical protein